MPSKLEKALRAVSALNQRERQEFQDWLSVQPWYVDRVERWLETVKEMLAQGHFRPNLNWERDDQIILFRDEREADFPKIGDIFEIEWRTAQKAYHRRKEHVAWLERYLARLRRDMLGPGNS
jgi:hypothetical protein